MMQQTAGIAPDCTRLAGVGELSNKFPAGRDDRRRRTGGLTISLQQIR
jgi:hypothetical protein